MATGPTLPADLPRAPLPDEGALALLPVPVATYRGEKIRWVNAAFASLLRYRPDELIGRSLFDIVDARDAPRLRQRGEARRRGDHAPEAYEVTLLCGDGSWVRVEIEPQAVGAEDSLVVVRDLGDRLHDGALLGALGEIALRVQRARTVTAVVDEALDGLHAIGFQVCLTRTGETDSTIVALRAAPEIRALVEVPFGERLDAIVIANADLSVPPEVLTEQRPVFLDDAEPVLKRFFERRGVAAPPDLGAAARAAGVARLAIAPLVVNRRPWGVLFVGSRRLRSNDAAAVSLFASQLASALEVAEAIENLERQNRSLEAIHQMAMTDSEVNLGALVRRLLRIAIGATGSDAGWMYLHDRERNHLALAGAVHGSGPSLERATRLPAVERACSGAAALLQPRAISAHAWDDVDRAAMADAGIHELAIVPLVVNGRFGGTVNLSRRRGPRYGEEELRSAEQLVAQMALQIERARLYADARRRVEDLALINEVGGLIAQHLELDEVLSTAMRHVSRIVEVPNTFLMLLEPDGSCLKTVATNLAAPKAAELVLAMDRPSAAAEAVRTRAPVAMEDAALDPRAAKALTDRYGHRALLSVPLMSQGHPIGALVLGETRGPRRFAQSELDRAVAVANQLASAIDRARLYAEQRQRIEHLRLLVTHSQVITGSLELEQILEASARGLVQMVEATSACIWLLEGTTLRGVVCTAPEHQQSFKDLRIPLSEDSAVSLAIRTRAPVRIEDASRAAGGSHPFNLRCSQRGLLALPLMHRELPIGAISIADARRSRVFTEDEVDRALLMSRQVAVAIDNARLFSDLKRSYEELSRAQQELVKRERLAALGELSAVVAHEVRNPLQVIFNSLATVKRVGTPDENTRMLLSIVDEEAERLNRMVTDLLDFARPHVAQMQPEPLRDVVTAAVEAASRAVHAPQVKISMDVPESMPAIPLDAEMIRRALVNLVLNAVQAMPNGGRVDVKAGVEPRDGVRAARIDVEDDGPGMPPQVAERIFQPFFTTKAAGTGLGLPVVKRIVEAHGGEIAVRSAPGAGTTFTLWLPAPAPSGGDAA